MELYILNRDLNVEGVIDQAESVLWQKKYNDVGECEIYAPFSDALYSLLRRGYFVFRFDDDMACLIQSVQITTDAEAGNYIIATGKDICSILAGRIVRWQTNFSGTVPEFVRKILLENVISPAQGQRGISRLEISTLNFAELNAGVDATVNTEEVLALIVATCKSSNYGFRMSIDAEKKKFVFRLYAGKNKATVQSETYVEFSPEFANILATDYKEDESNFKNVVYVGYKDEKEELKLLSCFVGDAEPTGEDRKEIYVDGTGTSRDITLAELEQMFPGVEKSGNAYTADGETVATSEGSGEEEKITVTDYTYLLLIRRLGLDALASAAQTVTFSGTVDTVNTYEYRVDFDLGDVVLVKNEYGVSSPTRIVEVMESEDAENGYQCELKFEFMN